ncbi:hypothetical protein HanRHA438_Chr04g0174191 [Helianthus annuus]|nr:hypothetical protein HanRHA438_Chr04g0174191 [Helianthus annuus]
MTILCISLPTHTHTLPQSGLLNLGITDVNRGAGFKGRGGAPDPPNFSVSSVMYVHFV